MGPKTPRLRKSATVAIPAQRTKPAAMRQCLRFMFKLPPVLRDVYADPGYTRRYERKDVDVGLLGLSVEHVILEDPLDWKTLIGIGGELRSRLASRPAAPA